MSGFDKFKGTWKVTHVTGAPDEAVDHLIEIGGTATNVTINCLSGLRPYPIAVYEDGEDEIVHGRFRISHEVTSTKNKIYFLLSGNGPGTGSWSAEDNGGLGGGEEG